MLHGQEAEYAAQDKAEVVPLRDLRGKGIDYLALGHVHGYKRKHWIAEVSIAIRGV